MWCTYCMCVAPSLDVSIFTVNGFVYEIDTSMTVIVIIITKDQT